MAAAAGAAELLVQPSSSRNKLVSVGLCFSGLPLRFFVAGSARVGGGVPTRARAAAFTAEVARNGFGLRGFDGIAVLSYGVLVEAEEACALSLDASFRSSTDFRRYTIACALSPISR